MTHSSPDHLSGGPCCMASFKDFLLDLRRNMNPAALAAADRNAAHLRDLAAAHGVSVDDPAFQAGYFVGVVKIVEAVEETYEMDDDSPSLYEAVMSVAFWGALDPKAPHLEAL